VKETKAVETLDEAYARIVLTKLDDADRVVVDKTFDLWRNGTMDRPTKITKKSCFEAYETHVKNEKERKKRKVIDEKPDNHWVIVDIETFNRFFELANNEDIISADFETDGIGLFDAKIVGVALYLPKADVAAYIPYGHTTGETQLSRELVLDATTKLLQSKPTVWFNGPFDLNMASNEGIDIRSFEIEWDGLPVAKLLNDGEPTYKLKNLYAKYVTKGEEEAILFEDLFEDFRIYDKSIALAGPYACLDGVKTWKLRCFQKPYIETVDNLRAAWEIERNVLIPSVVMSRAGFNLDYDRMNTLRSIWAKSMDDARDELIATHELNSPEFLKAMSESLKRDLNEFNINSGDHLRFLIYDRLVIDSSVAKRFRKPERSTAAEVLEVICEDEPSLLPLKKYRTYAKLITTYIDAFPEAVDPKDNLLHTIFNPEGTASGRYSSYGYKNNEGKRLGFNAQNAPAKGDIGKELRSCLLPPKPGYVFISSDFSQLEPRITASIMAEEYGDTSLRDFFVAGRDPYAAMASMIWSLPYEACADKMKDPTGTFEPRKVAKALLLAITYGLSYKSLARKLKVADERAKEFFAKTYETFPGLRTLTDHTVEMLKTRGKIAYAESLWGRKRRFHTYRENIAELSRLESVKRWVRTEAQNERRFKLWMETHGDERAAVNHRIQATAAQIAKLVVIALAKYCDENGFLLVSQIHDQNLVAVPIEKLTLQVIADIDRIMTETVKISTPLKCETTIGRSFGEEIDPSEWFANNPKEVA
jgi:DNA polymerase I